MSTAVVIGGGLGGLSASYYLGKSCRFTKVILVEASNRCGGWVQTDRNVVDGSVFEHGPRSCKFTRTRSVFNMIYLTQQLGLADEVLPVTYSNPAGKNRFIYLNRQMYPLLDTKFQSLFKRNAPFTKPLIYSILKDTFFAEKSTSEDESIYSFFRRRGGEEMALLVANSVVRGIYAGDTKKLSMKSCFPSVFEGERKHGSVRKAVGRFSKAEKLELLKEENRYLISNTLVNRGMKERWAYFSFKQGYQQFTEALEKEISDKCDVEIRKNSPCTSVQFKDGIAEVQVGDSTIRADHVVSAMYAKDFAGLVGKEHTTLSQHLSSIPAVNIVLVSIELAGTFHPTPMGFGHLIPDFEDSKILGVVYDSCMFEEHDRKDSAGTRFTMMMGGAWYDDLLAAIGGEFSESKIQALALGTLFMHLNMAPVNVSKCDVALLKNCIPQYLLGHSKILDNIDSYISENKLPLSLVGSSYKGVSTTDVVYNSRLAVENIIGNKIK